MLLTLQAFASVTLIAEFVGTAALDTNISIVHFSEIVALVAGETLFFFALVAKMDAGGTLAGHARLGEFV